jgi:signal transduction histidine kinase
MASELDAGRQRALEAERADAFRESARRFAHELKNPLTPIRFAVERLRRQAPDELRDTVEVLAEESARLDAMARSFAQFGRLPDGPAAEIDVAELVSKTVRNTVPDRLTVDLQMADDLPLVVGFHDALARAVTNVLLNAVDACPRDGRLTVRVANEQADSVHHIVIVVRDTGGGIGPDVLAHMFDPYVTTKPGGTGLGLAIARQTMAAHGGTISATSTPGVGTELRLQLPVTHVESAT